MWIVVQTEQSKGGHWSKCLGIFDTLQNAKTYVNKVYPIEKSQGYYDDAMSGSVQILEVPNKEEKSVKFDQFNECPSCGFDLDLDDEESVTKRYDFSKGCCHE